MNSAGTSLVWGHSGLQLEITAPKDGPATLRTFADGDAADGQPLVEILTAREGRGHVSHRFSETVVGRRLRLTGSERSIDGSWHELRLTESDRETGLVAEVRLRSSDGVPAFQVSTTVTNEGAEPILLLGVTSLALGLPGHPVGDLDLISADSEWLGENRWTRRPLRALVPDINLRMHGQDGRGQYALRSTGTWSTGTHLPVGGLTDRERGHAWLWQVEHNGPWRWEVGERVDDAYVGLLGPTDIDHQWSHELRPGESFTTVPASLAVSRDGLEGAVAVLTAHRRALRRPHPDNATRPVIFNDYMNTLMGDPTTAKLLPLIDAAANAGAEVFCIDAGWYDNGAAWWDSVGEWQPSQTRFPRGIEEVLAHIRERGLVAGLWLEPEVIGVRSPMAEKLPDEAFLRRGGVRLVEHGRYHLDLRHPAAVEHLDDVVNRLVEELGVGYLKLDYNIDPGAGTDIDSSSAGAGLLGHNRAHLEWLDRLLDRHPDLILENCASGGMRADYALLARMQLQSTSDQQDHRLYPPIAVAAPMSIVPEQAASWAYPQPGMSDEEIAHTLCTGLLGRLYLSGHLDRMRPAQRQAVQDAVQVHRAIRADLATAVPAWPLGLPGWDDRWLALVLRTDEVTYLGLWRRPGASATVTLPLEHTKSVEVLFPRHLTPWTYAWDADALTVTSDGPDPYAARVFRITHLPKGPK
ncbi:glycoside hydrolase family 36 protein [Paractinoplanes globisporus]|uniref:Glycoside hydrolase family 36 protein n=1 Tax=Paractinoplanes globisporus TaxID=113565 RepID=A0ABW6WAP5_9ACTN|nr:glycoside hydrolase family 36 protein [Actinoplanes globisporus]